MAKKPRNPIARSPLLRKGGEHKRSKTGERMKSRKALRREAQRNAEERAEEDTEAD